MNRDRIGAPAMPFSVSGSTDFVISTASRASSKSRVQARHLLSFFTPATTMKNPSLLTLVVVVMLLLAASPLAAAAWSRVSCGSDGSSYAANSTYEANLHRLAAVLPAEIASASHRRGNTYRAIGYSPNRLRATSSCWGGGDSDCAACIAEAFKELQRECPFRREAYYSGDNCYLRLAEFRIFSYDAFGGNTLKGTFAMVMIFQAFGLACIFLLFLQAWRHDSKKRPTTRQSPLLSGDQ
ncbi:hypothetical protein BS78_02G301200 [Paspalum vaginatum]|nr:hypothetical protein BS78_02G301200 [Paspalum vaginatum]